MFYHQVYRFYLAVEITNGYLKRRIYALKGHISNSRRVSLRNLAAINNVTLNPNSSLTVPNFAMTVFFPLTCYITKMKLSVDSKTQYIAILDYYEKENISLLESVDRNSVDPRADCTSCAV